ncbi:MAG: hypothetical protein MIL41_00455 [Hyphomicrobiales bacterium]|jgi:hypothetical protein
MSTNRLITPVATLIAFVSTAAVAQFGTPNPIDILRGARDYEFVSSLFPQAGAKFDPERDQVMSADKQAAGSAYLSMQFDVQKAVFNKQSSSVFEALNKLDVHPLAITSVDPAKVELVDDQNAWSTTISPTRIILGARFLRGLVLGSLREASSGQAGFSQSLASFLGQVKGKASSVSDLESRMRLFFAAARNGNALIRTEEDFGGHEKAAVALMSGYLKEGASAEPYAALEARLRTAAEGGDITGVDGSIMFDAYMRLGEHLEPAENFVLSHEMGHVALGHAPFLPGLSCETMQKREDDADAFAVALLAYDVPGELEASGLALGRLGARKEPSPEDSRLSYGYVQAVRYGFALAGLSNKIGTECSYREPEDRIAMLDRLRGALMRDRSAAFEAYFNFYRDHPPFVHTNTDVTTLSRTARSALARKMAARCGDGSGNGSASFRKVEELPFGWVVSCRNVLPPRFSDPAFRRRLGSQTWRDIQADYDRHMPISGLLDDTTMEALTGLDRASPVGRSGAPTDRQPSKRRRSG